MATITTRSGKGSPLTHDEVDANFNNLNTDKLEASNLTQGTGISISGTTITNSAPDQTVSLTGSGIVSVSGTYPNFVASATALQAGDIGSSVQAYDANLTSFVSAFTLPTTDGTSGQALATNASGTLSFIDVAGDPTLGTLTKSFASGETATITLSSTVSPTAVVAVTKEIGQTGVSSKGAWDVASDASNYELYNEAPATSLSLSSTSADGTATLGTGSFSTADLGKRIFVDDGGEAVLTATDGSYSLVSAFGASSYTSGNWSLSGLDVDATNGITLSGSVATAQPTAQYLPALTSPAGQIDSQYWTDINSMTADDADNDGEVYYAVSTDDRTTWSIAKASDGVRNIVRNNGGTWEYNSAVGPRDGWNLSEVSYLQNLDVSSQELYPSDVFFKPDGLKMYVSGTDGDDINEYDLSTAWDVTSASYSQSFSLASQETGLAGFYIKADGTKLYATGYVGDGVYEYSLSTAWDVSTASYTATFSVSSQEATPYGVSFKTDGLKMYIVGVTNDNIYEYNLSTAWDISSASYSQSFSLSSQDTAPSGIFFKPDGTELYVSGLTGDSVYQYDLSTAWDVSSLSFSQSFSVASQEASPQGLFLNSDGNKLYVAGTSSAAVNQYDVGLEGFTTSETWNSATTNNEFAALAEALGATAANQMDKAQIDAVTDGSHFTLGDTLDLAIVPYLASAGTAPTSDGLSINYDAAALNKGAILGTDYDYDIPATDKVRITSLATQNLKVRIV